MSKDGQEKNLENETYHYPDEEASETETVKSPASSASRPKVSFENSILSFLSRHKRIVLIVLICIVVLIAFKWMKSGERKQMASNLKETMALQPSKPYSTVMESNEDRSQWRDMNRMIQKAQDDMSHLQDQVQMLQTQLNDALKQDRQLMKVMADWVQHNQAHQVSVSLPAKTVFRQIFYIKAIVPGRSWIADQWGRLQSVTLGTDIPEYGKVTSINSTRGEVTTDSGQVITYGFNDH